MAVELPENTSFFNELGLPDHLLKALVTLGYVEPTPIQAQAIPPLLAGSDVLGQAQTGTGKTAAFALPLLTRINLKNAEPQLLVLVPTRELALQVSEAFNGFAMNMPGLSILPVYGGQGFSTQLRELRRGVHIVIGTPGRIMDHMRRESLVLGGIKTLILDEADEMLRMGFAEDVEWILQHVPEKRQIGLFSATMPAAIKAIAETYLRDPERISIKNKTSTAATIQQFYYMIAGSQKVDALARVIEAQDSDAIIVFVKTKRATEDVAEQLTERGFNAVAINGDIVQQQRERVIDQLKAGKIRILVATDVAARGIDVDRITHVINFDAPNNAESYVHRIGRTGRAGRAGTAIIFITPRERYLLRNIEHATKQPIAELPTPSIQTINDRRINAFKQRITDGATKNISFFETLINDYMQETGMPAEKVAAVLAKLLQGDTPLVLKKEMQHTTAKRDSSASRDSRRSFEDREPREYRGSRESREKRSYSKDSRDTREPRSFNKDARDTREPRSFNKDSRDTREPRVFNKDARESRGGRDSTPRSESRFGREFDNKRERPRAGGQEAGMEQYRVEIGRDHGLMPRNLVGAIANNAGIEGRLIGKIKIEAKFSLVDLPKGMPKNTLQTLQRLKVGGKEMNISKVSH
ncbi:MAG TPA: DEAD/DEAH box helicase [Gammaproteobacteria bacterium]|nr:DEAD/DEAH box helicase [Gammaproteobacteria bacterium]